MKIISIVLRMMKATLRFWNDCVNDICQKMDQYYIGRRFTYDREKGNAMTVATDSFATFLLVDH